MLQTQTTLPIGAIIKGVNNERFVVEGYLGTGGFSTVYLVRDRQRKEMVFALKEMIDPYPHEQRLLLSEAELLKRLKHRAMPQVYQIIENIKLKRAYLLMDYIHGKNLDVLQQEQPEHRFSVELVLALLQSIVDAIGYLHGQKPPIIHRDIKPANIIIPEGAADAQLVDFGLAKEYIENKTTSLFRYGTPGYAAPEQYGQGTSPQTDIYSLAATIYTLIGGTVPTDALTRVISGKKPDPLRPVNEYNPSISTSVARVLMQAMSISPEERYPTIQIFWDILQQAVNHPEAELPDNIPKLPPSISSLTTAETSLLPKAQPISSRSQAIPSMLKHKGLLTLLILLLLLGSIGGTFIISPQIRHALSGYQKNTNTVLQHKGPMQHTPPPSNYPILANSYEGTIAYTDGLNDKTAMYLTNIQESQQNITSTFHGLGLAGPCSGTITQAGAIQLKIDFPNNQETLLLNGNIKIGGDITGEFVTQNQNSEKIGSGIWNLHSTSSN